MQMPKRCSIPTRDYAAIQSCPISAWDYESTQGFPYFPVGLCSCTTQQIQFPSPKVVEMQERLNFPVLDAAGHRTFKADDGQWYPLVTPMGTHR